MRRSGAVTIVALLICLFAAAAAHASDRVYWGGSGLSSANLDGSGAIEALGTGSTPVGLVEGTALDPVSNRIYWVDRTGNNPGRKIRFASLDGSDGGELNISGANSVESVGLSIDPVGRKIYWADRTSGTISFANLDGSGGGNLDLARAHRSFPSAVAIDPASRRVYWVNEGGIGADRVFSANLDGTGEGSLPTGTAELNEPWGAAIDPVNGRIYWANLGGTHISFANLDGSGGGNLNTSGAIVSLPAGVAVDPIAGRVYWANRDSGIGSTISFASLDGSGHGGNLWARLGEGEFPLLSRAPRSDAPPAITGGVAPGSPLSCSAGAWMPDQTEALFYVAPQSFTYQWSRNGADVPGATQSTLKTGPAGGDYRCRVTAQNSAGSTAQISADHVVGALSAGSLTLRLAGGRVSANGSLPVAVANSSDFDVAGSLTGRSKVPPKHGAKRLVKLSAKAFGVGAHAKVVVKLRLPKALRVQLDHRRKLSISLSATFAAHGGASQVVNQKAVARLP